MCASAANHRTLSALRDEEAGGCEAGTGIGRGGGGGGGIRGRGRGLYQPTSNSPSIGDVDYPRAGHGNESPGIGPCHQVFVQNAVNEPATPGLGGDHQRSILEPRVEPRPRWCRQAHCCTPARPANRVSTNTLDGPARRPIPSATGALTTKGDFCSGSPHELSVGADPPMSRNPTEGPPSFRPTTAGRSPPNRVRLPPPKPARPTRPEDFQLGVALGEIDEPRTGAAHPLAGRPSLYQAERDKPAAALAALQTACHSDAPPPSVEDCRANYPTLRHSAPEYARRHRGAALVEQRPHVNQPSDRNPRKYRQSTAARRRPESRRTGTGQQGRARYTGDWGVSVSKRQRRPRR